MRKALCRSDEIIRDRPCVLHDVHLLLPLCHSETLPSSCRALFCPRFLPPDHSFLVLAQPQSSMSSPEQGTTGSQEASSTLSNAVAVAKKTFFNQPFIHNPIHADLKEYIQRQGKTRDHGPGPYNEYTEWPIMPLIQASVPALTPSPMPHHHL